MERLNITVEKTPHETGAVFRILLDGNSALSVDQIGAEEIVDHFAALGITSDATMKLKIQANDLKDMESKPDRSVAYLEALLQAQAAHLADTRGILELTLNHIFGGRPAPQPTTPGDNNV